MMLTETDNTFGKREHLCKQTLIDQLFSGKAHVMTAWPLKMVYLVVDKTDEQSASVELMVSVSKRFFKRAVKRNRVKRQIREAYRKNKGGLWQALEEKEQGVAVAFIYLSNELFSSAEIENKVKILLARIAEKLE